MSLVVFEKSNGERDESLEAMVIAAAAERGDAALYQLAHELLEEALFEILYDVLEDMTDEEKVKLLRKYSKRTAKGGEQNAS